MPENENVENANNYPTPIRECLPILKELDYLKEMEEVKALLSEEDLIRFTNTPKLFVCDEHGCGGLGPYIRYHRKLYKRYGHENGDHMSFLLLQDLWDELQTDKRYVGQLKNPRTGENLPETDRFPNPISCKKLGLPSRWDEMGEWSGKKVYLELLQAKTDVANPCESAKTL